MKTQCITPRKKPRMSAARCECGDAIQGESASFWGECPVCRYVLPNLMVPVPKKYLKTTKDTE